MKEASSAASPRMLGSQREGWPVFTASESRAQRRRQLARCRTTESTLPGPASERASAAPAAGE
ncbi:MAG TPA: hypothetical protein DCM05_15285 [Elusimicrobia bacterium]|nr:hypothetical protein [Elusimicrobiota bacterium]